MQVTMMYEPRAALAVWLGQDGIGPPVTVSVLYPPQQEHKPEERKKEEARGRSEPGAREVELKV